MTQLKDLVVFRDDLYFEGAVQADWFYQSRQVEAVARSFVFHGPKNHAVSQNDFGGHSLLDTASFTLRLAQKMDSPEDYNPLTLAIAGYGTGKSHLAVTLSTLFSGEQWKPVLHNKILQNIARADTGIEAQLRPLVRKPKLVLTLNGMRDFNLHYELLRTAEKALKLYGSDLDVLAKLNKVKETATTFIERSYELLEERFVQTAKSKGIQVAGEQLKQHLLQSLDCEAGVEFDVINAVYMDFNGHPIRMDEGVSASLVLDTLLQECCGLHGQFDGLVILFDEFGRFLEYVSANPTAAGDSALQQIFESVQNAAGEIQFVGFIQSDIKSYLQRVDKSSNISRYIDRFDASEKIYLSSNLETIFANLLEKKDRAAYDREVTARFRADEHKQHALFDDLQKWVPLHGIWNNWSDYSRIILEEIYPLHPISTYLLCNLTNWLQSRSSLTLLSEKVRLIGNQIVDASSPLPLIYPVELLKGAFFSELLNAEEQGRQNSQFCILLNSIYRKLDTKLTDETRNVLLANLILRICRFHFETRVELLSAIGECSGLSSTQVDAALQLLENEYAVLSYDDRLICFDFIADSVGANEFRNFLKTAQNRRAFHPEMLAQNDILDFAETLKPIETDFGSKHGIQTREWQFVQQIEPVQSMDSRTVSSVYKELQTRTLPNTERGMLLWVYLPKDADIMKLDQLITSVQAVEHDQALVVFVLDDSDNALQEAILAYRVLSDMQPEEKLHFKHFYDDALVKAQERVRSIFAALKQQRKAITAEGITPIDKRLKVYLTSIFENVYPKAISFDFDGFDAKGANGAPYKNFCTIMKWILMDGMSYVALKSQSSDVKNRVDSLLGPHGLFSWRALNSDYKIVSPTNGAVAKIFASLESILNTKRVLSFRQVSTLLTSAPYGMNEYVAFMLLGLFNELFSYTTRLVLNDSKYSTHTWAEEVLQDKKFDVKLFGKTKLLLVDAEETTGKYRNVYSRIKKNSYFIRVEALREELDKLKLEDPVPEALEAEDDLASMLLADGDKARRYYVEQIMTIDGNLQKAKRVLNPYNALLVALDAQKLSMETYSNGRYSYAPEQTEEMTAYVEAAKKIASAAFADGWVKRYYCADAEKIGSYKHFAEKACDLFNRYGYAREALELTAIVTKEVARIQLLIDQEAFINSCENYLLTSQVRVGMTQKNLVAFQEQGNELVKGFEKFDFEVDKRFVDLRLRVLKQIDVLNAALVEFKEKLDSIWNAAYDISCLDDVRHVHARIEAVLGSGLTDRDRDDLENIDHEMTKFIEYMTEFVGREYSRDELQTAYQEAQTLFEGGELDLSQVLDKSYADMLEKMDSQEKQWIDHYLTISPSEMGQQELDKWKRDTLPLPVFLSSDTATRHQAMLDHVETELAKRRVSYITMLFSQLSDEEKKMVLAQIQ
ncbi:MAG: hypothetical protein PHI98_03945 [Eubacteriales bacterium]|nr:hypothetical protein [Eubacteriales bacterium]